MNRKQINLTVITMLAAIVLYMLSMLCMFNSDNKEQCMLLLAALLFGYTILFTIYFSLFKQYHMPPFEPLSTYIQTVEQEHPHSWPNWVCAIHTAVVMGDKRDMLILAESNQWMIKVYNSLIADSATAKADSE